MNKITFSVEQGELTRKDVDETGEMAEEFFNMKSKPDEIPASEENKQFILEKIPECDNIIKDNDLTIGFTFIVPCNSDIMSRFLSSEITENRLFEEVKEKVHYGNFDCIYLCSSFLKKEYRGKGLATKGAIMSIKKIIGKRELKPILFSWPQTGEGRKSAERTAKELGFELRLRTDCSS